MIVEVVRERESRKRKPTNNNGYGYKNTQWKQKAGRQWPVAADDI
jgi:hypothetical protein